MRSFRAVLLTIIATVALVGGFASTADAKTNADQTSHAAVTGPASATSTEPGDPGLPPD
ncbi:MAG TPA: hypothetical protein VIN70_07890 [Candidatus Limnocylindria bacterium]